MYWNSLDFIAPWKMEPKIIVLFLIILPWTPAAIYCCRQAIGAEESLVCPGMLIFMTTFLLILVSGGYH